MMAEPTSRRRDPHPITANTPVNRATAKARLKHTMKNRCLMWLTSSDTGQNRIFLCFAWFFAIFRIRDREKCRPCVVVESRFVAVFSLFWENLSAYCLLLAIFSTGGFQSSMTFPRVSHKGWKTQILVRIKGFSTVSHSPLCNFPQSFPHCVENFLRKAIRKCHTLSFPPPFGGLTATFQRQIHDILDFLFCHPDKMVCILLFLPCFF